MGIVVTSDATQQTATRSVCGLFVQHCHHHRKNESIFLFTKAFRMHLSLEVVEVMGTGRVAAGAVAKLQPLLLHGAHSRSFAYSAALANGRQ